MDGRAERESADKPAADRPAEPAFERTLAVPGLLVLPDGRRLSAHVLAKLPTWDVPRHECAVELDLDRVLELARAAAGRDPRAGRRHHAAHAASTAGLAESDAPAGASVCLRVRFARAGDRFTALGAPGSKALTRFLAERGIPRGDRSRVPLVLAGETILWVAGVRPCETARVGPATRRRLRLELDLG